MELTLFVDHACNLRCTYCYTGEKLSRPMSSETMRRAVALAMETKPEQLDVSFFGGEPLLRLDLLEETLAHVEREIAALAEPRPRLRFILNTNGTLIDDCAIALLKAHRFTVFLSVDGPRDVHDRHRLNVVGGGSHERTLEGARRLREARIPFQVMVVYGSDTASRLGDALRELLPLGAEKIVLSANYRDDWSDACIESLREGLADAAGVWAERVRSGAVVPVEPFHTKILSHLKGGAPCGSRCVLGNGEITVTPKGRIYPCPQMVGEDDSDRFVIGDLDTGIDWARAAALQGRKERSLDTCASCDLVDRCQSQCGCRQIALSGELGEITAVLCETEAASIEAADAIAEALVAEQVPAFLSYYYQREWSPAPGARLVQLRRRAEAPAIASTAAR